MHDNLGALILVIIMLAGWLGFICGWKARDTDIGSEDYNLLHSIIKNLRKQLKDKNSDSNGRFVCNISR